MKDKINGFTFYRNYRELIRYLPDKVRLEIYDAIGDYMFEGIEPELTGLSNGIWINLKMPLDTSKVNIENGRKGGRPKKSELETEIITETETESETEVKTEIKAKLKPNIEPKPKANNISTFLFLISNFLFLNNKELLRNKLEEWIRYKWERKEYYKETGFKSLLKQIENNTNKYGEKAIVNLIDECMANNYKGIIFDKLKKSNINRGNKYQTKEERDKVWARFLEGEEDD